jgi:alpha-tubulin suppressor-like RCC1 family protein
MTGANYAGQLLLGDKEDRLVFEKVTFFNDLRVKQVALGKEHSVVLTSNGNVYSCGSSAQGQTGLDTFSECVLEIQKVNISNVHRVYAGQVHSVFYTSDHEMFVCGSNKSGQLGLGEIEGAAVPIEVPFFAGREVVTVAVNHAEHTLVLLVDGIIWAAGANEMNQLGLEPNLFEDRVPFFQPVESYLFFNQDMLYVASGPFHSLFISERKQ